MVTEYEHRNKRYYAFGDEGVYIDGQKMRGMVVEQNENGESIQIKTYPFESGERRRRANLPQRVLSTTLCLGFIYIASKGLGSMGIDLYDIVTTHMQQEESVEQQPVSPFVYLRQNNKGKTVFTYHVQKYDTPESIAETFNDFDMKEDNFAEATLTDVVNAKAKPLTTVQEGDVVYVLANQI